MDNIENGNAKLMKPLFVNGMFNRDGKRIRAKYLKTLVHSGIEYPLWISSGKNEKDYTHNANDTHYLMIEFGEYLIPCGETEHDLEQRSGYDYLNKEWYGDFEGRKKYFGEIRQGKSFEEANSLIAEQIKKEEEFISEHGKEDVVQAEFLKTKLIDPSIEQYIDARDNNGRYVDFHGAAFLGELDKCCEISVRIKEIRKKEEAVKRAERDEKERKENEEREAVERKEIQEAENVFINGGTIKDGELVVKIADKHGVNIPIRTRGWMLNTLAECTISESGSVSYRYLKRKGAKGSQKVYDILFDIRKSISSKTA